MTVADKRFFSTSSQMLSMGSLPRGCIRQMLGTEETFHLAIQERILFFFFKKQHECREWFIKLSLLHTDVGREKWGRGGCCHTFPALFIYFRSIPVLLLCSDLTGNANRWVTITAERARSDFVFEMHHGLLSPPRKMRAAAATATGKISVTQWENGGGRGRIKLRISSASPP